MTGEGPFDVIIERRTLQLYPSEEREHLLRLLCDRLSPSGIFVSQHHMGRSQPGDPEEQMCQNWFQEHGFHILRERLGHLDWPKRNPGRIAVLSPTSG
jgi:hypothetical protein